MKGSNSDKTAKNPLAKWLVMLVVVVMLAIVAAGIWGKFDSYRRHRNADLAAKHRHSLISQAAQQLDAKNVRKLEPLTIQIKKQPNYAQDQSYTYILLIYSINISDSKAATNQFNQLQKAYRSDSDYDSSLRPYVLTQTDLKEIVAFLNEQAISLRNAVTSQVP